MSKEIVYNSEARQKVRAGIDKVANAVKVTLGPRGRNVVIKKSWGGPDVTKDGVTVAKEITLKDNFEDVGAQLCKQVATRSNDMVGDGTTTTTVLLQSLVENGEKLITLGVNPVAVKAGMDMAGEMVAADLTKMTKKVSYNDFKTIAAIAAISANNDKEVGDMVAQAFTTVGANGIVTFEDSRTTETTLTITEGFQFDRGFIAPHFVTDVGKMKCEYEDCLVLLWDKRLTNPNEMVSLLNVVAQTQKPLLIVADDVEAEALATLILNKVNGVLKVVAVKCPGFGERKKNLMSDLALLTGGTYFAEELGKRLEKVSITELGTAKKIIVTKDSTIVVGGAGSKEKIEEHLENLKTQVASADSNYDKEKITERIAKLSASVAVIKVGAPTEAVLKQKKYRFEDSISATKSALEIGYLPGGGVPYFNLKKKLDKATKSAKFRKQYDSDFLSGMELVSLALEVPLKTILNNAGFDEATKSRIFLAVDKGKGFDGKTGKIVTDMVKEGIIDAANAPKVALESAISVAGVFLTSEAVITEEPTEDKGTPNYGGMY
jgi:chaperonin GroEL